MFIFGIIVSIMAMALEVNEKIDKANGKKYVYDMREYDSYEDFLKEIA